MSRLFRTTAAGLPSGGAFKTAFSTPLRQAIFINERSGRDSEELAGAYQAKQTRSGPGRRSKTRGHDRGGAARARLWPNPRQFAAPRSIVVAARRGEYLGPYRRCLTRVLVDPRRARGRDRHRAQYQG